MECIIYRNGKGGVSILYPICSPDLTIEMIAAKDIPSGIEYKIVETNTIPDDKTFRDAWSIKDSSIVIRMDKAEEIWKNRWRKAREPKLKALDVEFMKAVEAGDAPKQAEIAAKKQALRDVTATNLSFASNTEELKVIWPDCLK